MTGRRIKGYVAVAALAVVLLAACAGTRKAPLALQPGESAVTIEADSFAFRPNVIKADQGTTLTITLKNAGSLGHNLTILSPDGKQLVSRDVAGGATEQLTVRLDQAGTYPMYCDKTLHSELGMKGEIQAAAR